MVNWRPESGWVSTEAVVNSTLSLVKASPTSVDQANGWEVEVSLVGWLGHLAIVPDEPPVQICKA